ncbi:hypothetical protein BX666DRAFT_1897457 [Dichotomocladium elegans]|nr:hypothetical protein BX666DRAFT_1897457 [Dichotomocladium elegans]
MNTLDTATQANAPLTSNHQDRLPPEMSETAQSRHADNMNSTEPSSPRTVRLLFLSGAWGGISNARKAFLLCSTAIVLLQLGSIVPALVISRGHRCDKPLDVFLIVFLVRSIVSLPLVVYYHMQRARERLEGQDSSRPQRRWTDRLNSLLYVFGIVWFIVGNYFLFTAGACSQTAPVLFFTALVWVLLGYGMILIPVVICASVVFCLPCVLVMMRTLNLGYGPGFVVGATQEEIDALPVYQYYAETRGIQAEQTELGQRENISPQSSEENQQRQQQSKKKRPAFFKRLLRRNKTEKDPGRIYERLTITPVEDALCSICLSEYEDEDLVCKLWCRHHFHKDCVSEWLLLNSSCPLCKRDIRTKDPESL